MGFQVVEFLQRLLRFSLVFPEFGLGGLLFQVINPSAQSRNVKDTPEFYPGDERAVRLRA
jgi:hypothetical protein